ncbi:iron-containing alcohol dehydrogenase [Bacillus sp. S/N-304-OC-R1]|uniref:iron-containing alcohol dehydrogenase n=1 Tax=Bacillus sp. S/N-304-OC-R1 TaxID=2758034 RepID=UPI0021AE386A|nr:iron-containing alcohol dehydrogenase [Bacillus sp. S/N-304-OC-R1]
MNIPIWGECSLSEIEALAQLVKMQISHFTAEQCKDLILNHSEGAVNAAKEGQLTDDFIKIVETVIVLGGMVGGFGDHFGSLAGAHSTHNGLTAIHSTHHALHGDKVAYGIIVQLVLEEKWEEIEAILPFYQVLGLPVSLRDIGNTDINEEVITVIAEKSCLQEESIHVMPIGAITPERVHAAITALETFTSHFVINS